MIVMMIIMIVMIMIMIIIMMTQEVSGSEKVEEVWPGHQGSVQDVK